MKTLSSALLACASLGAQVASMRVHDPSDVIPASAWAGDNALSAAVPVGGSQPRDINAENTFATTETTPPGRVFATTKNDTSVILVRDNGGVRLSDVQIQKLGYSTSQAASSLYGLNSAVNIANSSRGYLSHVNITTHNGASNVFVYGAGSRLQLDHAWLYSSGPGAAGILCAGNGTAQVSHVRAFSGGARSSSFSAAESTGFLNISSSFARTAGVGSACFSAVGTASAAGQVLADGVACETERAPTLLMDGPSFASLRAISALAGRLASTVVYSSGARTEGAFVNLDSVDLTVTGPDMPGLWFGNTVATVYVNHAEINVQSRLLAVANRSTVAPDFQSFAASRPGNATAVEPAVVDLYVTNSALVGDIVALRDSQINLYLGEGSSLTGTVYTDGSRNASVNVRISGSARWSMTNRAMVGALHNDDLTMHNIVTNGHNLVRTGLF